MAHPLSKADYLKRYMSDDPAAEEKKKKKKKKLKKILKSHDRVKIFDDDVDLKSLLPSNLENTLEEDVGDNEPTIAEVIDERPEEVKRLEKYRQDQRWKTLGESDDEGNTSDDSKNRRGISPHSQQKRTGSDSDQSPLRELLHDSDSDQSPVHAVRKNRHDSDSDQSPVRKERHDSDSDQSPVRINRHDSDSDQSPVRKNRHDSDSDQSPPRRKRMGSDSDQSPPRRKTKGSDSDQSPPRRKRKGSDPDQSPPRRKRRGSESDQSPPRRKRRGSESDQSPPRRKIKASETSQSLQSLHKAGSEKSGKPHKTLSGAKAGLSSAKDVRREAEVLRKRHDAAFNQIDDELLGKNAKTVFRDRKTGKRRNMKAEQDKQEEENAKKREEDKKYEMWGKGLKQQAEQDEAVEAAIHEMSKPLARARDDEDLDEMLKKMDRDGDPMAAFMTKKKTGNTKKEKPQYKGPYPPNRFGIRPGYRWDGVDRSSGFEKQYFAKMADRKATNDMAYKWSTEDM